MTQLALFDTPVAVRRAHNPLCLYERHCPKRGVVIYGEPRSIEGECVNRSMRCEKCGVTGELSDRDVVAAVRRQSRE